MRLINAHQKLLKKSLFCRGIDKINQQIRIQYLPGNTFHQNVSVLK